jgi:hypothetical protein
MKLFCLMALCAGMPCAAQDAAPAATFGTTVVIPSGLRGDLYFLHKGISVLPDFDRLRRKPEATLWTTVLDIPPRHWRAGFPGVSKRNEWFGLNYTGRFWIDQPGRYRFALLSDDGSKLYIDGQLIIDNDCQHPPDVRATDVTLRGGVYRIEVQYFQGPRDCIALILAVAGSDGRWRVFNTDEFKPPSNPEDWKYTAANDEVADIAPVIDPPKVADLLRELPATGKVDAGGCMYPPVHNCGK